MSHLYRKAINCCKEPGTFFLVDPLYLEPLLESRVGMGGKMCEGKPPCMGFLRNVDRILGIQVRPFGAFLPGFQTAFGNQKIGIHSQQDRIFAETRIDAVRDLLPVKDEGISKTRGCVDERPAFNRERDGMGPFGQFNEPGSEGKLVKGYCEGLPDERTDLCLDPWLAADVQWLG